MVSRCLTFRCFYYLRAAFFSALFVFLMTLAPANRCLVAAGGNSGGSIAWLSVSGDKIVGADGDEFRMRGIQHSFGSARGDLAFLTAQDSALEEFVDSTLDHVITEFDFTILEAMKVNTVRLSLLTYKDYEYDEFPFVYKEENFQRLDRIVEWAEKYGIYLILSMRQSPGGHNPSVHSGNAGRNTLWLDRLNQERIIALWQELAKRYSGRPIIAGYDLLNEPFAPDKYSLNDLYNRITAAIREVDSQHIIFLEGNSWAIDIDWIDPPEDANTVLSAHFYVPGKFAVEGMDSYPMMIGGQLFDKEAMREVLHRRIAYAREIKRPLYIGEFGAMTRGGNHLEYIRDVISLLEEAELHWTYYNFKNLKGKSDTQAVFYCDPRSSIFQVYRLLESDYTSLFHLDNGELQAALFSLETEFFVAKDQLKNLLSESLSSACGSGSAGTPEGIEVIPPGQSASAKSKQKPAAKSKKKSKGKKAKGKVKSKAKKKSKPKKKPKKKSKKKSKSRKKAKAGARRR